MWPPASSRIDLDHDRSPAAEADLGVGRPEPEAERLDGGEGTDAEALGGRPWRAGQRRSDEIAWPGREVVAAFDEGR